MFKRFTAPEIDRPFTVYCDDYTDGSIHKKSFTEIQFSGEWCNCFYNNNCQNEIFPLESIVKIVYTYYDWLKKRKVNQVVYKR